MPSMWTTLSRGRDGVMTRGADVVRRTRETGADLLGRAEQRASELQGRIAARRGTLNGRPIEKVERRVLAGIESILDRMGLGLRIQIRRLAPSAESLRGTSAGAAHDASARALPEAATSAPKKRRLRIEVRDVPVAATKTATKTTSGQTASGQTASGQTASGQTGRPSPRSKVVAKKKKARPAARSTRWISPPAESVEELAKLPVKALLAKVAGLSEEQRRALLAHEKATKKRKSVIAALAAN